jgi:hypothetical protein
MFMNNNIPRSFPWACVISAFAMACDVPWIVFLTMIGHNGDACPYSDPSIRVGFHVQECIEVAQKMGWSCTPIELFPVSTPGNGEEFTIFFGGPDGNWARFLQHLGSCKAGVIEGCCKRKDGGEVGHAVAWDGTHIYDPKGKIYSFSEHEENNFYPRVLWKLVYMGDSHVI